MECLIENGFVRVPWLSLIWLSLNVPFVIPETQLWIGLVLQFSEHQGWHRKGSRSLPSWSSFYYWNSTFWLAMQTTFDTYSYLFMSFVRFSFSWVDFRFLFFERIRVSIFCGKGKSSKLLIWLNSEGDFVWKIVFVFLLSVVFHEWSVCVTFTTSWRCLRTSRSSSTFDLTSTSVLMLSGNELALNNSLKFLLKVKNDTIEKFVWFANNHFNLKHNL